MAVETAPGSVVLKLSGVDLLDGTPVVDVRPYVPYADALPDARAGFAPEPPPSMPVHILPEADAAIDACGSKHPALRDLMRG